MRIIAICIFFWIGLAGAIHGQPFLNLGIRGGGNSSTISFVPPVRDRIASVAGYHAGGTIQYIAQDNLGIQLDVMAIKLGWRQIAEDFSESIYKIDFVHVPFTTYAYAGKKKARLFINAGIFADFRMDGTRTVISDDGHSQTFEYNYNPSRDNRVVYGLVGGGGISYDVGFIVVGADARMAFSYGNIMKPSIPERDFSRTKILSITGFCQLKLKR